MIPWLEKNRIRLIFGALAVFVLAYILQVNFAVPLFLMTLVVYVKYSKVERPLDNYTILHASLLFLIIFALAYSAVTRGWSILYIPYTAVIMLAVILFEDIPLAMLLNLSLAVSVGFITGMSLALTLFFLINGTITAMLLKDVRRRGAIIRAGCIIGILQAITWFFLSRFQLESPVEYAIVASNGLICSIVVIGILPVFEYLFRTVTNVSLLELADFDNALLQKMMLEAPGTYHHSLVVGNLSEAACQAIGAHALLARIGAYYHDIGKLSKPEYFSENMELNVNKHDSLAPTISKMVIMNHVREGIELARQHKLNTRLTDFIQQHHGTSLVYFFYRRALEASESVQEVSEDGFRYPGPKPNSREAAIVLLADSVEAAVRSLKDPTPANITEVVHKIINNKFIDGQLDECELTLKDLEKIAACFIRILAGIYHSRITYPEIPE